MRFLEDKNTRAWGDLSEEPRVFPSFQPGNIRLLTVVDHRGPFLSPKKTARTWFGCEQLERLNLGDLSSRSLKLRAGRQITV